MYEKVYTSIKAIEMPYIGDYLYDFQYNKNWDSVFGRSRSKWWRIFRDGTAKYYGEANHWFSCFARVGGYHCFGNYDPGKFYAASEVNGVPDIQAILNPNFAFDLSHGWPSSATLIDDLNGLMLTVYGTGLRVYNLDTGVLLRTLSCEISVDSLSWAGVGIICGIRKSDGRIYFADYLSLNAVVETGMLEPHDFATYDCLNNVFITLSSDKKIRVYVREALPAVLSEPEFIPATIHAMQGNNVRVRLTGETDEPCPDWWVHWELQATGGSGPFGWLGTETSKTDKEGYAYNLYFGPEDSTGQTKIVCSVVVP